MRHDEPETHQRSTTLEQEGLAVRLQQAEQKNLDLSHRVSLLEARCGLLEHENEVLNAEALRWATDFYRLRKNQTSATDHSLVSEAPEQGTDRHHDDAERLQADIARLADERATLRQLTDLQRHEIDRLQAEIESCGNEIQRLRAAGMSKRLSP